VNSSAYEQREATITIWMSIIADQAHFPSVPDVGCMVVCMTERKEGLSAFNASMMRDAQLKRAIGYCGLGGVWEWVVV
jgi:hypothetical protein